MASPLDLAVRVVDRQSRSLYWMQDNFYAPWEKVFKSYYCEKEPVADPNNGNAEKDELKVGLPMTWSHVRRTVARATAQGPNLRHHAKDSSVGDTISRTLMYQWDRGGVQREQKKHVTQATLFGISIRAWYWTVEDYMRSKRVDPLDPNLDPATAQQIATMYHIPQQFVSHPDPEIAMRVRAKLLAKYGRGGLLPIKYPYVGYVGPKCDTLFLGDCYFEPHFQNLQTSRWFIVERRRNRDWINRVVRRYPEFKDGFNKLLTDYPNGTPRPIYDRGTTNLRDRLAGAIGQNLDYIDSTTEDSRQWTILEQHCPGPNPTLAYVAEKNIWLGEIPYPYELDGKIAFTSLVFIDSLLSGIGDSTARVIRGLQELGDRQVNARMGLVYNLLRPLVGTTNRALYENPDLVKRYHGFRLVHMRGPNDMWVQGEQAAMAAAAAGLQDESAIMRQYQMATGDSNMSMAAQVDPQQNRTATGARLMAFNQDVLTKDLVDMLNETSIKPDAEMMFLLNRSELDNALEFNAANYNRSYSSDSTTQGPEWASVEPALFQVDGEITAEVGSTLADDDEARLSKAQSLYQAATARPDLFNQQTARDEFLIAMGKGRDLAKWAAPPPPPPEPPVRTSLNVAAKFETLTPEVQADVLTKAGIEPPPPAPMPPPDAMPPPGGPPGPMPPPHGMPMGPPPGIAGTPEGAEAGGGALADGALLAARGRSPFTR